MAHVHGKPTGRMKSVLRISLALTFAYILLTLIAGWRAHSLALMSEAGHNASDFLALLLSFVAVYFEDRPPTQTKTFGFQRAGVLAAFVNALTLIVIAVLIAVDAAWRLRAPVLVQPKLMIAVAAVGLVMNGAIAAMLAGSSKDLNIRSTFIHMLGDAASTAAVMLGGVYIYFVGGTWVDPALSMLIAAMVLWSAIGIVRETLNILLEGTPRRMRLAQVRDAMMEVEGVANVHDLHVWSLGSSTHALSSHVTISDIPPSESSRILESLNVRLRERFQIRHTTIQFEHEDCGMEEDCLKVSDAHKHEHAGHAH
jgi:cobalt-zinc-cadmium efflux system protein